MSSGEADGWAAAKSEIMWKELDNFKKELDKVKSDNQFNELLSILEEVVHEMHLCRDNGLWRSLAHGTGDDLHDYEYDFRGEFIRNLMKKGVIAQKIDKT